MKKPDNDLYFSNYINSHDHALKHTEVHDADGNAVSPQKGMDTLCDWSNELKVAGRCQHFIGNGASWLLPIIWPWTGLKMEELRVIVMQVHLY